MRRRAALERGFSYRYGGGLPAPQQHFQACLHLDFKDLRSAEEKEISQWISIHEQATPELHRPAFAGRQEDWKYQWDTILWKDNERLHDFEDSFWRVGGVLV